MRGPSSPTAILEYSEYHQAAKHYGSKAKCHRHQFTICHNAPPTFQEMTSPEFHGHDNNHCFEQCAK